MNPVTDIANVIYGEAANQPKEIKLMVGSTILNRMKANRPQEFGYDLPEMLTRGYSAVSNPNQPYQEALSGKFPDKQSEDSYKEALQIANGLLRGIIKPQDGQFYFTDKEVKKLTQKKGFDFSKVKSHGKVGKYSVFGY